jgi:hypothetical protein
VIVEILTWLGTPAITGVIVWLIQERYKNKLSKELENVRAELQRKNTKFKKLHEKRAEVIAKFYGLIDDYLYCAESVVCYGPQYVGRSDAVDIGLLHEEFRKIVVEFQDYWRKNKIYLPEELSVNIAKFVGMSANDISRYTSYVVTEKDLKEYVEKNKSRMSDILKECNNLKSEIEKKFRELLGDNN